jgi:DivIVA domain-containing protein
MGQLLLFIVVALVVATIVFGVTVMMGGGDSALTPVEPDGAALPLPSDRPLGEEDIIRTRFDTALRGYRMSQVDQALQRAAYDIGYKGELIGVLEAEVAALREGRIGDADVLRRAREAAVAPPPAEPPVAAEKPIEIVVEGPPDKPVPAEPVLPDSAVPASKSPAPQKSAPQKSASQKSAPQKSAPQKSAPDTSAPEKSVPPKAAQPKSVPPKSVPDDAATENAAPAQPGARSDDGQPVERR